MKKGLLLFLLGFISNLFSQNASSFLPTEIGNVWISNFYVLDSLGNPVGDPVVYVDSSVAYQNFLGKQTLFIVRRPPNISIGDTLWVSASSQSIFIHQRDIELDTFITFKLPDWSEYHRFNTNLGSNYTIYRFDTTLTIPQVGTLPLRFSVIGTRLGLDTLTVPAGFFNAVKFRIDFKVQYLISFPPLPPIPIDIVTVPTYDWLVQGRYIVKSLQEPFTIDTLNLFVPGSLRELVEFRTATSVEMNKNFVKDFNLYQNYPNPFNGISNLVIDVPWETKINLSIYDLIGRKVCELFDDRIETGTHSFQFDGEKYKLSSGIYFAVARSENTFQKIGMIFLK